MRQYTPARMKVAQPPSGPTHFCTAGISACLLCTSVTPLGAGARRMLRRVTCKLFPNPEPLEATVWGPRHKRCGMRVHRDMTEN